MNARQLMIADGAPRALFLTPDQRAKAWAGRALTPAPLFVSVPKSETPETAAFRAQEEERRRLKSLAGISRMKARFVTKAIDYSKMRWDPRRGKFVPDIGSKPKLEPHVTALIETIKQRYYVTDTGAIDWSCLTKDNAEAVAKLNGVWKDSYEKLRGTGRIVMTVGNMLKGIAKRGGEVKWQ